MNTPFEASQLESHHRRDPMATDCLVRDALCSYDHCPNYSSLYSMGYEIKYVSSIYFSGRFPKNKLHSTIVFWLICLWIWYVKATFFIWLVGEWSVFLIVILSYGCFGWRQMVNKIATGLIFLCCQKLKCFELKSLRTFKEIKLRLS